MINTGDVVGGGSPSHTPGSRAQILVPLALKYAQWLGPSVQAPGTGTSGTGTSGTGANGAGVSGAGGDEDSALVRAMPLILHLERDRSPLRSALLEAAGAAAVALCLDERSQPGGPWHPQVQPWLAGRIRKVARRARGAQWCAVSDLPGITIEHRGAQVRALLPWPVAETPKTVTRLQVGGTDVPYDEPGPPPGGLPVLWIAPGLTMTAGKAAAQVGHGTMLLAALLAAQERIAELDHWAASGYRCAVRTASVSQWTRLWRAQESSQRPELAWREQGVVAVRDAGFTEVAPGTVTIAAQWPATRLA